MTYKTHTLFGITTAVVTIKLLEIFNLHNFSFLLTGDILSFELAKFYAAVFIGSLLPDIDHANSKAGRSLPIINKLLKLFGVKHRGLTHSAIGTALFILLAHQIYVKGWIGQLVLIGVVIGYISHLLADMFNPHGIPIFFPNDSKYNIARITTGSWGEQFFLITVSSFLILFIFHHRNILTIDLSNLLNILN